MRASILVAILAYGSALALPSHPSSPRTDLSSPVLEPRDAVVDTNVNIDKRISQPENNAENSGQEGTNVGGLGSRELQPLSKRQWTLSGRIVRILAQITTGNGVVFNDILEVIFGGPGVVNPRNNTPLQVTSTEIDAGTAEFTFHFTVTHLGWRWGGVIEVLEDEAEIQRIAQAAPVQQLNLQGQYVNVAANLELNCGFI